MVKAWVLMVFVLAYPGDMNPKLGSTRVFETIRECFKGEIAARHEARKLNLEVVTGCIRMYEGEGL